MKIIQNTTIFNISLNQLNVVTFKMYSNLTLI